MIDLNNSDLFAPVIDSTSGMPISVLKPKVAPVQEAFYFVRILENPTPRWSTLQAIDLGTELSEIVSPVIRERAWSSPIWYSLTQK